MSDVLMMTIDGTRPLSIGAVSELTVLCDRAEGRDTGGVVTLCVTGAPGPGWADGLNIALVTKWERALRRLERLPAATIALAVGDCGGAALDTFLAADIRIATPGTRLLMPFDGEATWPGMAAFRLVRLAGVARVRRSVLFGQPISGAEALASGIADELTDSPEAAAATTAQLVEEVSGKELAIRRQLLFDAETTSFEDALGSHLAACDRALRRGAAEAA
ncbi:enoyl-CoA-hydratase DpgB [Streptomyces sp. NA02950]|uniref:enoyl-CoA-hydratase DpgB n=1 Tax=Streptomyces sp. NA02950 TaxID=2742137 RepID=UPI001C3797F7|nr:enoyl-CoA-hydratase DpgB [Streptomyces sp. NA02950]